MKKFSKWEGIVKVLEMFYQHKRLRRMYYVGVFVFGLHWLPELITAWKG